MHRLTMSRAAWAAVMILVTACGSAPTNPPGSSGTSAPAATASSLPTASPTPTGSQPATPAPSISPSPTSSEPLAALTLQPRPPALTSLAFADGTHGWLGGAGVILATADGGRTWHKAWSGAGTVLELATLDRTHAWAVARVAADGTLSAPELLRTTDGGVRWTATKLAHGLAALDFVSPSVGWAIEGGSTGSSFFGGGPQGRLVRTTDGGRTWTDAGAGIVTATCFVDARQGWASGGSTIRRTLDGGRTWRSVAKRPNAAFAFDSALTCKGGTLWLFQDIEGGAGGHVNYAGWRSTDGGRNWHQVLANSFFPGSAPGIGQADAEPGPFTALSASTAIELGVSPAAEESSVTITRDGGRTWRTSTLEGLGSQVAAGLAFPDPGHGFALGWDHAQQSILLGTTDGGRTWSERWPTATPAPLGAIAFVSPTVGFGAGIPGDGRAVLVSIDAGATWTRAGKLPEPADTWRSEANRLTFADTSHGWIVTSAGHLLATIDGGATWRRVTVAAGLPQVGEVAFADPLRGCVLASASDAISATELSTSDGGRSWVPVSGSIEPVAACARGAAGQAVAAAAATRVSEVTPQLTFLDDRTAWLRTDVGLDWTTDGGATWNGVTWPTLQVPNGEAAFGGAFEVTFASPTEGWMLATDGSILRTTDGGASWTELPVAVSAAACTSDQLELTSVSPAAGLGTVSAWLRFTNASDRRCSLRGWPTLVGVTGSGATSVARHSNVPLTLPVDIGPQAVTLGPGDSAFAEYEGSDNPTGTATTCSSYRTLRVTAPDTHRAVTISAWNAWLGQDLPACAGIQVTMVVSLASVSQLGNGPTAGTPPPALTVDHPVLSVSPSSHLRDGQAVAVRVTGLGVGSKVFLSECASAAVASDLGCGAQLAAQPFLVTDDSHAGHAPFIVSASASADPLGTDALRGCADGCVIVATLGDSYPFVVAPIAFDAP